MDKGKGGHLSVSSAAGHSRLPPRTPAAASSGEETMSVVSRRITDTPEDEGLAEGQDAFIISARSGLLVDVQHKYVYSKCHFVPHLVTLYRTVE